MYTQTTYLDGRIGHYLRNISGADRNIFYFFLSCIGYVQVPAGYYVLSCFVRGRIPDIRLGTGGFLGQQKVSVVYIFHFVEALLRPHRIFILDTGWTFEHNFVMPCPRDIRKSRGAIVVELALRFDIGKTIGRFYVQTKRGYTAFYAGYSVIRVFSDAAVRLCP